MLDKNKELNDSKLDKVTGGSHISGSDLGNYVGQTLTLSLWGMSEDPTFRVLLKAYDSNSRIATIQALNQKDIESLVWYTKYEYGAYFGKIRRADLYDNSLFFVDYSRSVPTYFE